MCRTSVRELSYYNCESEIGFHNLVRLTLTSNCNFMYIYTPFSCHW